MAEFTAKYAGYTCQQVSHDYRMAFEAAVRTAREFDWDAVVPNMVAAWTGMAQAAGLRYYGIPGIGIRHDGLQLHRAARRSGLHAGGRIRRPDRRPDGLPV